MKDTDKRKWAKNLLKKIESARLAAMSDERSNACYWNADGWGSASGAKDAVMWIEDQVIKTVVRHARPLPQRKVKHGSGA